MRYLSILIAASLLSITGCNLHAGFGVHDRSLDGDNFGEERLLGIVRISHEFDNRVEIYGEHVSQPMVDDSGRGLNHIGVLVRLR